MKKRLKQSKTRTSKRPVTMKQIAERAKVSLGTVSHVVNGTASVRIELKERVSKAMRVLGYRPSQLARGLRRNSTNMLGMVIPDITNPFFPAVVRGAEDVAFHKSYRLVLCNTDNDMAKERAHLTELCSFRPAGLLVIPAVGSTLSEERSLARVPIVCVDRCPVAWRGDTVLVANEDGAFQAAQFLVKLGHTRVAVIAGPSHLRNATDRLEGFRKGIAQVGIKIQPGALEEAQFDRASGHRCAMRLLLGTPRPTAIFASNDLIALGALQALKELGLRCPEDVSLVGFDDLDLAKFTDPPLTTVSQPGYELGATAARLVLERIEGHTGRMRRIVLPTELKVRNSASPPR
jgi:LacI family transcriptional regulator